MLIGREAVERSLRQIARPHPARPHGGGLFERADHAPAPSPEKIAA
jgi:hypothetical protein